MEQITAIILAAGQGKRMQSNVAKQYMMLKGHPVLFYSLKAFQESDVQQIILVVGEGEQDYVREDIVLKYGFTKVKKIVIGGKERYESVYHGLKAIDGTDYVLIHDGARPMITKELIHSTIMKVKECEACIVGVPSKDTVKIINRDGIVTDTPNRDCVWNVQTPQAFLYGLVMDSYNKLMSMDSIAVTDDAMVVEQMSSHAISMVMGSYCNIKITTPEDIKLAETLLLTEQ